MDYIVQSGDTLSSIAERELGSAQHWPRIYAANKDEMDAAWSGVREYFQRLRSCSIKQPADYLRFGQKLRLPR